MTHLCKYFQSGQWGSEDYRLPFFPPYYRLIINFLIFYRLILSTFLLSEYLAQESDCQPKLVYFWMWLAALLLNGPKHVRFDTHWSKFRMGNSIKKPPHLSSLFLGSEVFSKVIFFQRQCSQNHAISSPSSDNWQLSLDALLDVEQAWTSVFYLLAPVCKSIDS